MRMRPLNLILLLGGLAVAGVLIFRFFKGGVNPTGYSLNTPFGGGSVTENTLSGTYNVAATIKKKSASKNKPLKKFGAWLKKKKVVGKLLKSAASFIPGGGVVTNLLG
jgi:hypothetical protein